MIQSLKPYSATPIKKNNKTSFGANNNYQPQSKTKAIAKWAAAEFTTGAIVSLLVDGAANLVSKAFPKMDIPYTSLKEAIPRAGFWGAIFIAANLVFYGISSLINRSKS